jgi:hypothetical protein
MANRKATKRVERAERLEQKVIDGTIEPMFVYWGDRTGWREDREANEKLASMGVNKVVSRGICTAIRRATEDEEEEVRIYFDNESDPFDDDAWMAMMAIEDADSFLIVAIDSSTLKAHTSPHHLCLTVQEMIASSRPNGKPFGKLPSDN